jgi:hypothetical protein
MRKKIPTKARPKLSRQKHPRETTETRRPRRSERQSDAPASLADIADLIGSVDGLPSDLAANHKKYLKLWGYGRNKRHD